MTNFLRFAIISLLFMACNSEKQVHKMESQIHDLKAEFAPDKRVKLFEVEAAPQGKAVLLKGKTNLPDVKARLLSFASQNEVAIIDSIRVLPEGELKKRPFGIVNVSVANLRSQPKHSAELSTQALMGAVLRVWEQEGDFFLVQTPDDYFGWMDDGGFVPADSNRVHNFLASERLIVVSSFAFVFSKPSFASQKVSDLVAGDILQGAYSQGTDFLPAVLPDGRKGFVAAEDVRPFAEWLDQPEPQADAVIAAGLEMMGRPYLWGGTSGKGMDCSGFTKMAYFLNGVQLPRDASQQVHVGGLLDKDTTLNAYQPGDLLFFGREATADKKERIWHVAIYLGNGKILHASDRVMIQSLRRGDPDFAEERLNTLVRGRRIIGSIGQNGVLAVKEVPWYVRGEDLKN